MVTAVLSASGSAINGRMPAVRNFTRHPWCVDPREIIIPPIGIAFYNRFGSFFISFSYYFFKNLPFFFVFSRISLLLILFANFLNTSYLAFGWESSLSTSTTKRKRYALLFTIALVQKLCILLGIWLFACHRCMVLYLFFIWFSIFDELCLWTRVGFRLISEFLWLEKDGAGFWEFAF